MPGEVALTEAVYYILLSLARGERHGYGIMQEVGAMSGGRVNLAAGTLYGALGTLAERGWIAELPAQEDSRRKEYALAAAGRTALEAELARLRELAANGAAVLEGGRP
ncbi:MAG: helix-turn-helix transcriptional regulator [Bifidobacteriaceae bacterium]|nr:helix-turn-helix transcriptional regulator [Bifidobacteriaceae bacterium]